MHMITVNQNTQGAVYSLRGQNLSFEVDYNIFMTRFWPKVAYHTRLDSLVVWTQIFSEIKGRVNSYEYEEGGISAEIYIRREKKKKDFLTQDE